jgi:hypothetical protein
MASVIASKIEIIPSVKISIVPTKISIMPSPELTLGMTAPMTATEIITEVTNSIPYKKIQTMEHRIAREQTVPNSFIAIDLSFRLDM